MKKICYLCEHSVEVKYIIRNRKEECLFCIAAPPSASRKPVIISWADITAGYKTIKRYARYPEVGVSDVAPCDLYVLTKKEKKIEKYKARVEEEKQEKAEEKIHDEQIRKEQIEEMFEKKKILAEQKEQREKKRQEKRRKKKRKEYQKQYRARKKTEEAVRKIKNDSLTRFDILDLTHEV